LIKRLHLNNPAFGGEIIHELSTEELFSEEEDCQQLLLEQNNEPTNDITHVLALPEPIEDDQR